MTPGLSCFSFPPGHSLGGQPGPASDPRVKSQPPGGHRAFSKPTPMYYLSHPPSGPVETAGHEQSYLEERKLGQSGSDVPKVTCPVRHLQVPLASPVTLQVSSAASSRAIPVP